MLPMANVHQPSIRARTAAHDASLRSSTIEGRSSRVGVSFNESVMADHGSRRERPHWTVCLGQGLAGGAGVR